jgi:hypothetical protein
MGLAYRAYPIFSISGAAPEKIEILMGWIGIFDAPRRAVFGRTHYQIKIVSRACLTPYTEGDAREKKTSPVAALLNPSPLREWH